MWTQINIEMESWEFKKKAINSMNLWTAVLGKN